MHPPLKSVQKKKNEVIIIDLNNRIPMMIGCAGIIYKGQVWRLGTTHETAAAGHRTTGLQVS